MTSEERRQRLTNRMASFAYALRAHGRATTAESAIACAQAAEAVADHYRTATGPKGHFMPMSNHGAESIAAWDLAAASFLEEARAIKKRWDLYRDIQTARDAGTISPLEREQLREGYSRGDFTEDQVRAALRGDTGNVLENEVEFPFII